MANELIDNVWGMTHAIVDTHDGWQPKAKAHEWFRDAMRVDVCRCRCGASAPYVAMFHGSESEQIAKWLRADACRDALTAFRRQLGASGELRKIDPVSFAKPKGPSDAEIVAAYERAMQCESIGRRGEVLVNGSWLPMADVRAAWSRELKRRTAASDDARRLRTQVDDVLDHEAADVRDEAVCMGIGELAAPFDKLWR